MDDESERIDDKIPHREYTIENVTTSVLIVCNFLLVLTVLYSLRTRPHDVLQAVREAQQSIEQKIAEMNR